MGEMRAYLEEYNRRKEARQRRSDAIRAEKERAESDVAIARTRLKDQKAELDNLERKIASYGAGIPASELLSLYFNELPNPIQTADADTEGRFTAVVPKREALVAVARSESGAAWMIKFSLDGKKSGSVKLNEANSIEKNSPDSAVKIKN